MHLLAMQLLQVLTIIFNTMKLELEAKQHRNKEPKVTTKLESLLTKVTKPSSPFYNLKLRDHHLRPTDLKVESRSKEAVRNSQVTRRHLRATHRRLQAVSS